MEEGGVRDGRGWDERMEEGGVGDGGGWDERMEEGGVRGWRRVE